MVTPELGQALIGLTLLTALTIGRGVTTSIAYRARRTAAARAARRALRVHIVWPDLINHLRRTS